MHPMEIFEAVDGNPPAGADLVFQTTRQLRKDIRYSLDFSIGRPGYLLRLVRALAWGTEQKRGIGQLSLMVLKLLQEIFAMSRGSWG